MFVHATQFSFEPMVSGLAIDSTGVKHTTSNEWAPRLRDLAAAKHRRGQMRFKLALNQGPTSGEITLRLKAGSVTKHTEVVTLTSATEYQGLVDVDLSGVASDTQLKLEVDVTGAAGASTTAEVVAALDVSTIAITSSC